MALHFFGIRHHGPGCARSLAQALQQLQPDAILIEGPPEADELLPLAAHAEMRPPVALLVYAPAMPQHASHFPFAEFSPEWQAIQYGQAHGVPTRFIDLPMAHTLAANMSVAAEEEGEETPQPVMRSGDAMAQLAQAAGFSDFETWWDHLVEQRHDSLELFAAIEEMMSVARKSLDEPLSPREAQREAHMRQMIRLGINKALWVFGVAQAVAILGFVWLAGQGPGPSDATRLLQLGVVIGIEAFGVGLGTTAFVSYIARTTSPAYAATQYALFTSLMAVPRTVVNAFAGVLVERMGWVSFFWLCFLLAVPGMLLLVRVAPWNEKTDRMHG